MLKKKIDENGRTVYFGLSSCCKQPVSWYRGEKPELCPHCGQKYFEKPGLEHKLFLLQDDFLADYEKTGSTRILGEKMFPLLVEYAENLIKGLLKGKARVVQATLAEKSNDAATALIEVIMKDPDHKMRMSFGGYLERLCRAALYRSPNSDREFSWEFLIGDKAEFGDLVAVEGEGQSGEDKVVLNLMTEDKEMESCAIDEACGLLAKSSQIIAENTRRKEKGLLYLIGIVNKFSRTSQKILSGFYSEVGNEMRGYVEKGELLVFDHLRHLAGA
jgi:hypothetical protein